MRLPAVQRSPFSEKMVNSAASSARLEVGVFEDQHRRLAAQFHQYFLIPAASMIRRPVAVPPVKDTARTSRWRTSASPALAP